MATKNNFYVDGFVMVIPKKNLAAYKKMALVGAKVWKKHGALDYKECVGDDMAIGGETAINTFPKLLKLKEDEVAAFSYILFASKKHRNEVNKKVMADPEMNNPKWAENPPFEMKKMTYGGFKVLVS